MREAHGLLGGVSMFPFGTEGKKLGWVMRSRLRFASSIWRFFSRRIAKKFLSTGQIRSGP